LTLIFSLLLSKVIYGTTGRRPQPAFMAFPSPEILYSCPSSSQGTQWTHNLIKLIITAYRPLDTN
jgi:hypothetical protein